MDIGVALTTFVLIVPVELPDKTFVASLVLATRYRPVPVWCGVAAAFAVQVLVAVLAGSLITLLPRRPLLVVTATLFAVGGVALFAGARKADEREAAGEQEFAGRGPEWATVLRAAAASFLVLFLAEWGDLSQLLTAGLVVRYRDPVSVGVAAWAALACVALLAVLVGRTVLGFVRLATIQRVGGSIALVLAGLTLVEALRGR